MAVAALFTLPASRLRNGSSRLMHIIRAGSETTAQTTVRLVFLLLISLGVLALVFDLDLVLGAFAAGFVLRQALPDRDEHLEHKLDGLAFGFLIPVFFVTSGMAIDPRSVASAPLTLVTFVILMLLLRGVPVYVASRMTRDPGTDQSDLQHEGQRTDRAVRRHRAPGHRGRHVGGRAQRPDDGSVRLAAGGRWGDHRPAVADDGDPAGLQAATGSRHALIT